MECVFDDLVRAASEALEEEEGPDEAMRLMPRRLAKAIEELKAERAKLLAKADRLLTAQDPVHR